MEKEKDIDELFKGLKMKIIISGRKIDKNCKMFSFIQKKVIYN